MLGAVATGFLAMLKPVAALPLLSPYPASCGKIMVTYELPNSIWIGNAAGQVYWSDDEGRTWIQLAPIARPGMNW